MYYIKYILSLLLIIIIINIIYYLYNSKIYNSKNNSKNNEKFTDIKNISGGKIDSRSCRIYLTDNISKCDNILEYYKKGITQLDILINKNKGSKNSVDINFVKSLNEIKSDKLNNITTCKIDLPDWKEIKNYYDLNGNPLVDSIIPFKNTKSKDNINIIDGFSISGFCFKEYKEGEPLNISEDNNNFVKNEYMPITNIIDMSDTQHDGKKYVAFDIKLSEDLNFNTLNSNLCDTNLISNDKNFDQYINDGEIFFRIKSYMDTGVLKSKYIEFIKFNKIKNNFDIINDNDKIQEYINKLFRHFYNTINKNIEYGPIKMITEYIIIEYNTCYKIEKIIKNNLTFSLANFNIPNFNIGNYYNLINENLITKIDDDMKNYKDNITTILSDTRSSTDSTKVTIIEQITERNKSLESLKKAYDRKIDLLKDTKAILKKNNDSLQNQINTCNKILNADKVDCDNKSISLRNTITTVNSEINRYISEIKEIESLYKATQIDIDILNSRKKEQEYIYDNIQILLNKVNKKYTLKDINDFINDKAILNIQNYINNVSNDDFIYIKYF